MYRVMIAAVLVALIATAPVSAAGGNFGSGEVRNKHGEIRFTVYDDADVTLFDYCDEVTGGCVRGYYDSRGTVALEGLVIQPTVNVKTGTFEVVASWAGQEVVLPDAATVEGNPESMLPFTGLVEAWGQTIDRQALEGLLNSIRRQAVTHDGLTKASSCGWEIFRLVGVSLGTTAICSTGILIACAGAYIVFLSQLHDTAEACNWCGFGRPC